MMGEITVSRAILKTPIPGTDTSRYLPVPHDTLISCDLRTSTLGCVSSKLIVIELDYLLATFEVSVTTCSLS